MTSTLGNESMTPFKAARQGFVAYRDIYAVDDIEYAQAELRHAFKRQLLPISYRDESRPQRVSVVTRTLGRQILKSVNQWNPSRNNHELFLERFDDIEEKRSAMVYAASTIFSYSTGPDGTGPYTIMLWFPEPGMSKQGYQRAEVGQKDLTEDRRVTVDELHGYNYHNFALPSRQLQLPLAYTYDRRVAEEVRGSRMTREIVVPLGPLKIEQ